MSPKSPSLVGRTGLRYFLSSIGSRTADSVEILRSSSLCRTVSNNALDPPTTNFRQTHLLRRCHQRTRQLHDPCRVVVPRVSLVDLLGSRLAQTLAQGRVCKQLITGRDKRIGVIW